MIAKSTKMALMTRTCVFALLFKVKPSVRSLEDETGMLTETDDQAAEVLQSFFQIIVCEKREYSMDYLHVAKFIIFFL